MTPVALRLPYNCLPEFFEIINAYGAYIRERDFVKKENKQNKISTVLSQELSLYLYDRYEKYASNTITESTKLDIEAKIKTILEDEKSVRVKNLISTQKYYKKLKHKFKENYPSLDEIFDLELSNHQSYMENKKRVAYHKHNEILALSSRFIAFFNYHFDGGKAQRIAYKAFANNILNRTDYLGLSNVEIQSLHDNLGTWKNYANNYKLTLSEIELLAKALKIFVDSINEGDTQNIERYIINVDDGNISLENKKEIALSIIVKNIERFTELLSVYEKVSNK